MKVAVWIMVAGIFFGGGIGNALGQAGLLAQLGCANCHTDLPAKSNLRDATPDLSSAGLRYDPAWLFEFLRKPSRVKRHLGPARMPQFHFSDREALALTAFLGTQIIVHDTQHVLPERIRDQISGVMATSAAEFQGTITNGLVCLSCHTYQGKGGNIGIELSTVSYRLRQDWVQEYLAAPSRFGVLHNTMPAQFFDPTNDFRELVPEAARKIQTIAGHLFSLNTEKTKALRTAYETAKTAFPGATAELGRKIFISQNCTACHRHHQIQPRTQAAPDLTKETTRVTSTWLASFLKRPYAIRPFGYQPGDGSRMPDFALSDGETKEIVGQLHIGSPRPKATATLSAFAKRKATALLTDKLSCLGCHRFGETGGRIGPDLTHVRDRLQPHYVRSIIMDPRKTNPHTIMPRIPMPDNTMNLIVSFLLQHDEKSFRGNYLSLTDNPLLFGSGSYVRYCAPCHGELGRGDGFNAAFLPKGPTAHADKVQMSRRPDDTLYDAIHAGGGIVNKSHLMPPWGQSLSPAEINELVAHIRQLCNCSGPAWARDNRK